MRKREYLSPSAIAKRRKEGIEAYYLSYLSDTKLENEPQTQAMSIGSSFDAYAKSYLHERLFGKGNDPRFEFETIFEEQVEPHNRDWAKLHGKYVFNQYTKSGALNDLYIELSQAQGTPRFEFEVRGAVKGLEAKINNVVFLGKPDVFYYNSAGFPVILDWKVNGYCSKGTTSPKPGFIRLRHCDGTSPKSIAHKDAVLGKLHGATINTAKCLEEVDEDWAGQLAVYGWLCGQEVGSPFLTGIDQLVCKETGGFPEIRVAEHRTQVSRGFQIDYFNIAQELWETVHSDHIFREMTKEDSDARCKLLDGYTASEAVTLKSDDDLMFKDLTNTKRAW